MQNEITSPIKLLDDSGRITSEGWARRQHWKYDRTKIKAHWSRIKEWDYYAAICQETGYGVTMTLADLGYGTLGALCWLDYNTGSFVQDDSMILMTKGRTGFAPSSGTSDLHYSDKKLKLDFTGSEEKRILDFEAPAIEIPGLGTGLKGSLELHRPADMESIVIATSWKENRKAFYYNEKVNCMPAHGTVTAGNKDFDFGDNSFACLDWGRGRWTYQNRWYWGSASGLLEGVPFGWNIGYGFSDRSPATENCIFYNNRVHKLEEVTFHIDTSDYMKPWKFTSSDGRFELDFEPSFDRCSDTNLLLIRSEQHQVFGYFTGTVILDDGTKLKIDRFPGFAEDVYNRW